MKSITAERNFFDEKQYQTILLSGKRMKLAILAIKGDDEACAKLIIGMTRLILKLAIEKYRVPLDQLEDVVQEAYLELFKLFSAWQPNGKTVPKFKPELGYNPITYAHSYIRKAIEEHIKKNGSAIKLSRKNSSLVAKVQRLLSQEYLSQEEAEKYIDRFVKEHAVSLETFMSAFQSYRVLSLDKAILNEGEPTETLLDFILSSQDDSPETHAMKEKRADLLHNIIDKALSPREALVLRLKHGSDGYPLTFTEISERIGQIKYINKKTQEVKYKLLSKERIRQIFKKAEIKLKEWMDSHPQDKERLQKMF